MTEENDSCDCNGCNDESFIGMNMFGSRDVIAFGEQKVHTYVVILVYQRDDEHGHLWSDKFVNFDEHTELATRYKVPAVGPKEAIDAAMRLDAYRKAAMMTGWINTIDPKATDEEKLMCLNDMGDNGLFNRFFFTEPTTIQCVLEANEEAMIDKSIAEVMEHTENTGNITEQWLKDMTEDKDGDSE